MLVRNHNWRVWHWPHHYVENVGDEICGDLFSHFLVIGPFQWHWYSKHKGLLNG